MDNNWSQHSFKNHNTATTEPTRHNEKLAQGAMLAVTTSIVRKACMFLYNLFFVRIIGIELYGLFVAFDTVVKPLSIITALGGQNLLIKEIAEAKGMDLPQRAADVFFVFLGLVVSLSFAASLLVTILAGPLQQCLGNIPHLAEILHMFSWMIILLALEKVGIGALVGFNRTRMMFLLTNLLEPSVLLLALLPLAVLLKFTSAGWVFVLVPDLLALSVLIIAMGWLLSSEAILRLANYRRSLGQTKRLVCLSLPLVGHTLASIAFNYTDKAMVAVLIGQAFDLSVYNVTLMLANFIMLFHRNIVTTISPAISRAVGARNTARVCSLYREGAAISFILAAAVYLVFLSLGQEILSLYGPKFADYSCLLAILGIGHLIDTFAGTGGYVLIAFGRSHYLLYNSLASIATNFFLNLYFVQAYGVVGAAIANSLSYAFLNILLMGEIFLLFGIHPFMKHHVLNVAIVGLMTACFFSFNLSAYSLSARLLMGLVAETIILIIAFVQHRNYIIQLILRKTRSLS